VQREKSRGGSALTIDSSVLNVNRAAFVAAPRLLAAAFLSAAEINHQWSISAVGLAAKDHQKAVLSTSSPMALGLLFAWMHSART